MTRFSFDPKARYRMPVMFGPTVGPRQGPKGEVFDGSDVTMRGHAQGDGFRIGFGKCAGTLRAAHRRM